MKERFKRIIASLLAAMMVFAYMPAMAFADDGGEPAEPAAGAELSYDMLVDIIATALKGNDALRDVFNENAELIQEVYKIAQILVEPPEAPEDPAVQPDVEFNIPPEVWDAIEGYIGEIKGYFEEANKYVGKYLSDETVAAGHAFEAAAAKFNRDAEFDSAEAFQAAYDELVKAGEAVVAGIQADLAPVAEAHAKKVIDTVTDYASQFNFDETAEAAQYFAEKAEALVEAVAGGASKEEIAGAGADLVAACQGLIASMEEDLLVNGLDKIIADTKAFIEANPDALPEDAQAILGELLEKAADFHELMKEYEALANEYAAEYGTVDAITEALDELEAQVEEARKEFEEAAKAAAEAAYDALVEAVMDQMDAATKVAEDILADYGLTLDDVMAYALDVAAYASGLADGNGYLDLMGQVSDMEDKVAELEGALADKESEVKALEGSVADLQKQLAEAKKSGASAAEVAELQNALKVTQKKVSIKKPKSKKKKVTAKWKKVKGVKVSGYQVQIGSKKYTAKATAKSKKSKKLKKGKKVKVKVRAYVVYKGKKYYGPWSKTKKIKVK